MPITETRGVRNRNPGNIDYNPANQWQCQLKPDPQIEKRFARFDTPENGIRALVTNLPTKAWAGDDHQGCKAGWRRVFILRRNIEPALTP
ncbi:structural protein P5, putative [Pseudomonas sp. LBUM920]|nr:structural protein P5, putative [Pseudomonas sp. LBUM920]